MLIRSKCMKTEFYYRCPQTKWCMGLYPSLSIKQQFEHQIIAEKLEANRNLLRLNTNDTIMLEGIIDKKSVIDAILILSLIELK